VTGTGCDGHPFCSQADHLPKILYKNKYLLQREITLHTLKHTHPIQSAKTHT